MVRPKTRLNMFEDEEYYWGDDDTGDTGGDKGGYVPDPDFEDNGDGSLTDNDTGEIWDSTTGEFVGWENEDGTWVDVAGFIWNEENEIVGTVLNFDDSFAYDENIGAWYDKITGELYNADGEVVTAEMLRDPATAAWVDSLETPAPSGGFWDGVKSFFGAILGAAPGGKGGGGGGSSGGGFGGGGSSGAAQQRAEQSQQKLQQAQQQGAPAQTIAALQQQLRIAEAAAATAAAKASAGVSVQTLAVGAAAVAAAFFLGSRRR